MVCNVYNKIKNYYDYYNDFMKNLQNSYKSNLLSGYLVELDWFNKWKHLYDYEKIKYYLDSNKTKKEIIDFLIYMNQKNCINSLEEPTFY